MTSIETPMCVCKTGDTEKRTVEPSLKARDLTLIGSLPKQSNLENYKKCLCLKGKCKMSQLIRLCQEDPDIIINMYRISKSEDKCLPEIDLDAGQTGDSTEKLDGESGKRKYHYLMTDHSTSSISLKDWRQEFKAKEKTQHYSFSYPSKEIAYTPKPILRKTITNAHLHTIKSGSSDTTVISHKAEQSSIFKSKMENISLELKGSGEDKAKNVIMVEPRISKAIVEKNAFPIHDSSQVLSLLNMVVKQQKQSMHSQQVLDESEKKIGIKCLNWLRCVPCVKNKKSETEIHSGHRTTSIHSENPSIDSVDTIEKSIKVNESLELGL